MSDTTALSCRELVDLVTEYLEGAMAPADRARFELHIGHCSGCERYLEQMRMTIMAMGRLTEATIEPEARERLLRVFRGWKASGT
jgi:anti-sigma factor RsiW